MTKAIHRAVVLAAVVVMACGGGTSGAPSGGTASAAAGSPATTNAAASASEQPVTVTSLKLAHAYPTTTSATGLHPATAVINKWVQLVEQDKNSHLTFTVYGDGQLGSDPATLTSVTNHAVDVGVELEANLEQYVPAIAAPNIPFLFGGGPTQLSKVFQPDLTSQFNAVLEPKTGTRILGWIWNEPNEALITTKVQVKTPGDLKGLKIRAPGEFQTAWMEGLGANAQQGSATAAYLSMQTGALDGSLTGVSGGIFPYKWYEVTKYLTYVPNVTQVAFAVTISTSTWNKLTQAQQSSLLGAMRQAEDYSLAYVKNLQATDKALVTGAAPNMNVFTVPADQLTTWTTPDANIQTTYLQRSGTLGQSVLDLVRKAAGS